MEGVREKKLRNRTGERERERERMRKVKLAVYEIMLEL
jgi:hypothetical protein